LSSATFSATPRPLLLSSFLVEREDPADGHTILRPIGELESATVPVFRQAVAGLEPARTVVVDLAAVPFLDSCGIGALIGAVRRVRELRGDMVLAAACPPVSRVLNLTGVDRIVELVDTVAVGSVVLGRKFAHPGLGPGAEARAQGAGTSA